MKRKNKTEMEIGYEIRHGSLVGKQAYNFSTWSSLDRSSITACEGNDLLSNARGPLIDEIFKVKSDSMDTHQKNSYTGGLAYWRVLPANSFEHEKIETNDWLANAFTKRVGS